MEDKVVFEYAKKYSEPDEKNPNNYFLDTSAYNYILCNEWILETLKKSVQEGFCYYSTAVQDMELEGKGAKTYNRQCVPVIKNLMPPKKLEKFKKIDKELNIMLVPEVAICMREHTRIDGTNRFLSPNSIEGQVFQHINGKNKKGSSKPFSYTHDAVIAEAAIHYKCILVTEDSELRETVNKYILNGAITTDTLFQRIRNFLNI